MKPAKQRKNKMLYSSVRQAQNFIPEDDDDMVFLAGLKAMGIKSMILPIDHNQNIIKSWESGYSLSVSSVKAFKMASTILIDGCREKAVSVRYWQLVSLTETENGMLFTVEKEVIK
jgi:hypothetical protein